MFDKLPRDLNGNIILQDSGKSRVEILEEDFFTRFEGATNYKELIAHINCTSAWKAIFDKLKKNGFLD
jgi:hypothetical protein